jgi:hypothetical protein
MLTLFYSMAPGRPPDLHVPHVPRVCASDVARPRQWKDGEQLAQFAVSSELIRRTLSCMTTTATRSTRPRRRASTSPTRHKGIIHLCNLHPPASSPLHLTHTRTHTLLRSTTTPPTNVILRTLTPQNIHIGHCCRPSHLPMHLGIHIHISGRENRELRRSLAGGALRWERTGVQRCCWLRLGSLRSRGGSATRAAEGSHPQASIVRSRLGGRGLLPCFSVGVSGLGQVY